MSRNRNDKIHPEEVEAADSKEVVDCVEENTVAVMEAQEFCLQADAEQAERLDESEALPAVRELSDAQELAMSPAMQALWTAVLPLVGTHASRPGEFPGVFKVEAGEEDEALIYLDVPTKPYQRGRRGDMDRVLALSVKLGHDYRRLGDRYYCIDCETPSEETRH